VLLFKQTWPQLTLLDVHKLPEVRESQKKNEILRRRVAGMQGNKSASTNIIRLWIIDVLQRIQQNFRFHVDKLERRLMENRQRMPRLPLTDEEIRDRSRQAKELLREAENALISGAYDTAEKAFIGVISLEEKNPAAYRGLGDVYFAEHQFVEARQTYRYALFLDKRNEHALLRLAEIAEAEGAWEQAIEYYQQTLLLNDGVSSRFLKLAELFTKIGQPETALVAIQEALALEPQNPKYLDNYIEASILVENKKMAEDGFQRLRMVNPENQKLTLFRERIDALPS
jgi:tetratricopeptide (TPR) repeat protein